MVKANNLTFVILLHRHVPYSAGNLEVLYSMSGEKGLE